VYFFFPWARAWFVSGITRAETQSRNATGESHRWSRARIESFIPGGLTLS
jgi:hypothetical protein